MRELIYLSERKLAQFHETGSPRRRWRRRVSELGATAPLGLGELQFTLTDAPQGRPNLERVLRHIESLTPKPAEYSEVSPDAGRWVKFKTRMNYQLVRPTTDGWNDNGELVEHPVGPAAVVFWEPDSRLDPSASAKPQLVLHGSPEHLLGLAGTAPDPEGLSVSRTYPPGFMDLLYGDRPRNGENPGTALSHLLRQLDGRFPPHAAGLFAGYARVTFGLEMPFSIGGRSAVSRVVVASPLYVEHAAA
ncbi:SAVMC3_10250 family protein [Streptomyces anulatus]|uniref:SAVMC3_10250 family protein n=1 Tax=Streptomyces anulatus TaxID=1892 RepID=UPI00225C1EBA|nr:SAVMC3_10250 family protein [Streptomyces anulatus]MCX4489870.1 SAVMC3_10250 family protein [Streptomyces anulatus]